MIMMMAPRCNEKGIEQRRSSDRSKNRAGLSDGGRNKREVATEGSKSTKYRSRCEASRCSEQANAPTHLSSTAVTDEDQLEGRWGLLSHVDQVT